MRRYEKRNGEIGGANILRTFVDPEIVFDSDPDYFYRLQLSQDLASWSYGDDSLLGNGSEQRVALLVSDEERLFARLTRFKINKNGEVE